MAWLDLDEALDELFAPADAESFAEERGGTGARVLPRRDFLPLAPEDIRPEHFEAMARESRLALSRAAAARVTGPRGPAKTVTPRQRQDQKNAWSRAARAARAALRPPKPAPAPKAPRPARPIKPKRVAMAPEERRARRAARERARRAAGLTAPRKAKPRKGRRPAMPPEQRRAREAARMRRFRAERSVKCAR